MQVSYEGRLFDKVHDDDIYMHRDSQDVISKGKRSNYYIAGREWSFLKKIPKEDLTWIPKEVVKTWTPGGFW